MTHEERRGCHQTAAMIYDALKTIPLDDWREFVGLMEDALRDLREGQIEADCTNYLDVALTTARARLKQSNPYDDA